VRDLDVGVWLGVRPDQMIEFARRAEAIGCESVWCPEHLVWPAEIRSPYPYAPGGAAPVPNNVRLYDPWVLLAAVATATSTIRLGTCVYVLPLRHALVTARAVATLDLVSDGRAILGAGLSWMAEEFAAVGIDFRTRGALCDEIVPVLRSLWSENITEYHGRHVDIPAVYFEPKPPQGAALPIVFGGESDAALRRAARLGDGWLGTWHTPESIGPVLGRLSELLADGGRSLADFEVTVMVEPSRADLSFLRTLHEAGVQRACVGSAKTAASEWPGILDRLAPVIGALRTPAARLSPSPAGPERRA
jgi:probable F420-dependent oxidoreductase